MFLRREKTESSPALREKKETKGKLYAKFPGVNFGNEVQILGLDYIVIGEGTCIGDGCWINDCIRDRVGRLQIGCQVLVGRRSVISTAGTLEIGDFSVLAPDVIVADADHVFEDPFQPILQQGVTANRSLIVEENCWLAFGVRVIGGLTIGRGSVVGAGATVLSSVPPFCVVVGSPARIVKMYDFESGAWISTPDADSVFSQEKHRLNFLPPDRAKYREKLRENNRLGPLGAELGGAGISF